LIVPGAAFPHEFVMHATYVLSGTLIVLSSLLMVWHARAWEAVKSKPASVEELRFRWRQFRRRATVSILLAAMGVAALVSQFVEQPVVEILLWLGVLLMILAMLAFALLDIRATATHIGRLRRQHRVDRENLLAEVRKMHGGGSNGHANSASELPASEP